MIKLYLVKLKSRNWVNWALSFVWIYNFEALIVSINFMFEKNQKSEIDILKKFQKTDKTCFGFVTFSVLQSVNIFLLKFKSLVSATFWRLFTKFGDIIDLSKFTFFQLCLQTFPRLEKVQLCVYRLKSYYFVDLDD